MNYKDNNKVTIVGLLSEIDIIQREKDGKSYVTGNFKIQVTPENIVQINVFAYEMTKAGKINPAYDQIMNLMNKGVSLAAVNGDASKATKVRTTTGRLEENQFVSRFSNNVISTTRVASSFFSTTGINEDPKANFQCGIYITGIQEEEDVNGDPTGRLIVKGAIEQFNRWDVISFIAESKQAVDYIESNWNEGDTVSISGRIVSKTYTQTITHEDEGGFGEPEQETRTYHRTEYIITSGGEPKEEGFGYNVDMAKQGIIARQHRMDELLNAPKAAKVDDSDF